MESSKQFQKLKGGYIDTLRAYMEELEGFTYEDMGNPERYVDLIKLRSEALQWSVTFSNLLLDKRQIRARLMNTTSDRSDIE